jgi:hypothetical protein
LGKYRIGESADSILRELFSIGVGDLADCAVPDEDFAANPKPLYSDANGSVTLRSGVFGAFYFVEYYSPNNYTLDIMIRESDLTIYSVELIDFSQTESISAGEPTAVPQSTEIFPAMSKAEHKALHTFFSNFSESRFDSFDINNYDEISLVSFAMSWNWINNNGQYSDTKREVNTGEGYAAGKYWSIPESQVDKALTRFFGVAVKNRASFTQSVIENGSYSSNYYSGGNYYRFEVYAAGEPGYWSQVTSFVDNGDGTYTAQYDVYAGHVTIYDNIYSDKDEWTAYADSYWIDHSCTAVVKPYDNNGKVTYQLISLKRAG